METRKITSQFNQSYEYDEAHALLHFIYDQRDESAQNLTSIQYFILEKANETNSFAIFTPRNAVSYMLNQHLEKMKSILENSFADFYILSFTIPVREIDTFLKNVFNKIEPNIVSVNSISQLSPRSSPNRLFRHSPTYKRGFDYARNLILTIPNTSFPQNLDDLKKEATHIGHIRRDSCVVM